MPRGRLPSGAVVIAVCVPASITVRSPEVSLVTNTRSGGIGAGAGGAAVAAGGAGFGALSPQATMSAHAVQSTSASKEDEDRIMRGMILPRRLTDAARPRP